MKQIFTIFFLLLSIYSEAQTLQKREISSFNGISSASGIIVEITQGNEESVSVSATNDDYLNNIKTVVENGLLKIYFDSKNWKDRNQKNLKLKAFVTYKTIDSLSVSSGSILTATNTITGLKLNISVTSGSQFNADIKTDEASIIQSSGAISKITGSATVVSAKISSGTVCNSPSLLTDNLTLEGSSGAVLKISVNKSISVKLSSRAQLNYKGDAVINKRRLNSGGAIRKI